MKNKALIINTLIGFLLTIPIPLPAQRSFGGRPFDEDIPAVRTRCLHPSAIELPTFNVDSVLLVDSLYDNVHGALHFAHKIPVNINPENSGETFYTEDGTKVWRVRIHSQDAYSLNVIFDTFRIPEGAKLFLYDPERRHVLGSFTCENHQESGEFPIAPVPGEELVIEYQEPADAAFAGELQIYEVNHDYRGLRVGTKFQYLDMPCLPHLSCNENLEQLGRSVCLLILNGDTYCTGTFINNVREDGKPYILTAAHCLNNNAALGNRTVVFLNYDNPRCMAEIRPSEEFSLSGCQTRALSNEVDFALLELSELPKADYRPYFAGWDILEKSANNQPFTCIHHPYGEPKRYATEENVLTSSSWIGRGDGINSNNHWNVYRWEIGHTWVGSSGSPLFDKNMHIVGTLTGGDSGGSTGCSSYTNGDYFAKLSKAWHSFDAPEKQLKHWLDPDNSGVKTLNGYDPYKSENIQRICHIQGNDTLSPMQVENFGYLFGSNQEGIGRFAEKFELSDAALIYGVYLMPFTGKFQDTAPVNIRVISESNPSETLAEAILNPYYTDYKRSQFQSIHKNVFGQKENYVRFNEPVLLKENFFITVDINATSRQSAFAFYGAKTSTNHAYYFDNGWHPITQSTWFPQATSLWIEPLLASAKGFSHENPIKEDLPFRYHFDSGTRTLFLHFQEDQPEEISFYLYNTQGHLISNKVANNNLQTIRFENDLPEGLYVIHLRFQNRSIAFKLIL